LEEDTAYDVWSRLAAAIALAQLNGPRRRRTLRSRGTFDSYDRRYGR
jgi:hypothetical protein